MQTFFQLLISSTLLSATLAFPTLNLETSFEEVVKHYNHRWIPGSEEWHMRKSLFIAEILRMKSHNQESKSWKEGINKFTIMTPDEKKAYGGRSKYADATHDPKHLTSWPEDIRMKPVSELPKHVDWRNEGIVSAVKDQGYCGSCWAFASTAVVESAVAKTTGLLFDLSVQQMAMCAPNPDQCGGTGGCAGSTAELAFDYVAGSTGLYEEYQQGYTAYNGVNSDCTTPYGSPVALITSYVQLPTNNYTALMNAVATFGPIAVSVDADFGSYTSGIYGGCDQASPDIDHLVVLVGYGEDDGTKYWLIRNSWSPAWGEKGYIRLLRTDNDEEKCGIDTTPQDGSACSGQTDPVKVCGTCGILYDTSFPLGATAL